MVKHFIISYNEFEPKEMNFLKELIDQIKLDVDPKDTSQEYILNEFKNQKGGLEVDVFDYIQYVEKVVCKKCLKHFTRDELNHEGFCMDCDSTEEIIEKQQIQAQEDQNDQLEQTSISNEPKNLGED
jgi:hypothetical protein